MLCITVYVVEDFRKWLKRNHRKEKRVAVVLYKRRTGKPAPTHRELINEAICFGWIDTTLKRIDDDRYIRYFTRRNEKTSRWSDNTLRYAWELLGAGRMTPEGIQFYELGKAKPTHDAGIPKNPEVPSELTTVLLKNKKACANFEALASSTKRMLYRWILRAKRSETREKRVRHIVRHSERGSKDFMSSNTEANG